ncbi:MAG TPA: hypothetical protein P5137_07935 [Candidatus Brocadiia bacterium]|mgnify:CR=1 FL=1|nr:hypothetical protein [Candidatus Brocadiia bacterium]
MGQLALSQPQRVCVYCSSSDAVAPAYFDAARELGAAGVAAGCAPLT